MASYVYSAPTKKRKQATFTEDELEVMVTEVTERKQVIFPAFSETITRRLKDTAWREVTAAVNRVSRAGRMYRETRHRRCIQLIQARHCMGNR
ncbi:hypothetical protein Pcinc_005390 [Petrolisthes cinctipes]|nr:hypothetical protein Pcinc_005390 [Petrolisthes cinctipes]